MSGKAKTYAFIFVVFAIVDALTTWFGVRMRFTEANAAIAERLKDPVLFFGSYAFFTALGVGVIAVSIKFENINPAFKLIALGMIILKAVPAINNVLLLMNTYISSTVTTTARLLLSSVVAE